MRCGDDRRSVRSTLGSVRIAPLSVACGLLLLAAFPTRPLAQTSDVNTIGIVFVRELQDRPPPLSLLDLPPADEGLAGARLAIADNTNTGRLLGQEFRLDSGERADADELLGA